MRFLIGSFVVVTLGCGGGDGAAPALPSNYADSYQEVRNCRYSIDHGLVNIRVLAAPEALAAYTNRTDAFPVGAIIVKEEYAEMDGACGGTLLQLTVMQKLEPETSPAMLDWHWEKISPARKVLQSDDQKCISCHTDCGRPPDGYDGTCTVP